MKKTISVLLAMILMLSSSFVVSANTNGSMENFKTSKTYTTGQFVDVSNSDWYAQNVKTAYELSLVNGTSNTTFSPNSNLTIAEAITLASRMNNVYYGNTYSFVSGDVWYQTYVDYAIKNGIIKNNDYSNFNAFATRSQFAQIFASALPDDALEAINQVADNSIPDVSMQSSYSDSVYKLYRAGILTGSDNKGSFFPNSNIQRSEVATIVSRMANVGLRQQISLNKVENGKLLTAEEIYAKCSPAVFYIETYDAGGNVLSSGSGFFVDEKGTAVTNYHVIEGAYTAFIQTSDTGTICTVLGVYDYSEEEDWAILKIDYIGKSNYLVLDNTTKIAGGQKVYAIGSPLGLQNTISEGIVSNPARVEGEITYIQTNAAISPGSSGGALIDTDGEVIGITSAGYTDGQNLNLALPISYINGYDTSKTQSFIYLITGNEKSVVKGYENYPEIPDFGAFNAVAPYKIEKGNSGDTTFYYSYDSLKKANTYTWSINLYEKVAQSWGFVADFFTIDGEFISELKCETATHTHYVYYDFLSSYNGVDCVEVLVYSETKKLAKGYSNSHDVPDFGEYFNISPTSSRESELVTSYYYSLNDLYNQGVIDTFFDTYWKILESWGFKYIGDGTNNYGTIYRLKNDAKGITINYSAYNGQVNIIVFYF